MFVVIFEVQPKPDRWDAYLAHAAALKPELEQIDGFLDNERFSSRHRPGWLVSLSTWRDEKALVRWRTQGHHHAVQADGRANVFQDYRLHVGEVAPDGRRDDLTVADAAKAALLVEGPHVALDATAGAGMALEHDRFDSIPDPAKGLRLSLWPDAEAALAASRAAPVGCRARVVRILRSYGMFDRAEAPQYHAPVAVPAR